MSSRLVATGIVFAVFCSACGADSKSDSAQPASEHTKPQGNAASTQCDEKDGYLWCERMASCLRLAEYSAPQSLSFNDYCSGRDAEADQTAADDIEKVSPLHQPTNEAVE